ncbi:hypothetical protein LX32DRAFT_647459 [Colletotrichum zoysiae]|uniref:Uncharacterized protein n=1 Tax=Colletotrichum zoysiae TaxID=1216348 RepID=A0AAD9H1K2_9PEZI|nr:hypothetical protein LX32DRAFT_647459 [Colletotrichum zoysiae]
MYSTTAAINTTTIMNRTTPVFISSPHPPPPSNPPAAAPRPPLARFACARVAVRPSSHNLQKETIVGPWITKEDENLMLWVTHTQRGFS